MSLLFIDGFDHYAAGDVTKKWASFVASISIAAATPRRAGSSYLSMTFGSSIAKTVPAAGTFIAGAAYYLGGTPTSNGATIFAWADNATTQVTIAINSTGFLEARRGTNNGTLLGTSSVAISTLMWNYLEAKVTIHNTTGAVTIKLNGATILTLTGQNTRASANNSANQFILNNGSVGNGIACFFDDLYLSDSSGSAPQNDFLGDCRIDCQFPNADGSNSTWTPSTGTTHYTLVDEATPNTTDYVESNVIGNKDTWAFQDLSSITGTIYGVQINTAALKDDAGGRSIINTVKSGATNADGATQAMGTSQQYFMDVLPVDPATSAAWTESNFNAAEFGVKVAA